MYTHTRLCTTTLVVGVAAGVMNDAFRFFPRFFSLDMYINAVVIYLYNARVRLHRVTVHPRAIVILCRRCVIADLVHVTDVMSL